MVAEAGWHVPVQQMSEALTAHVPGAPPAATPASIAHVPATHWPLVVLQTGLPALVAHWVSAVHLPQWLGVEAPHNAPFAFPAQSALVRQSPAVHAPARQRYGLEALP